MLTNQLLANHVSVNSHDPKKLWQSLRKVLHCTSETVLPAHSSDKSLADMFASFFSNKISKIRDTFSTSGSFNDAPDSVPPAFNAFMPVTEDEVYMCISESPTKSCSLDPIPTFLLKDCLDVLLSSITKLVNYSLIDGSFPNSFKKAVVTPLIKKASIPRDDLKNYRPVSGLCFLPKLVERVVARQLTSHINNNKLDNPHQSAYKLGHSTETVLLSIKNEVHLSVLLDLSAAFDTIDHNILLGYLKSWFGLGGTVLRWFASYLRNRCQAIKIGSTLSELSNLIYGVPQGLSGFNQHKLQSIQDTLARIVTNHRKYAHVTPILQKLHWLPVKYRCIFKTTTLVYKFLHSGSPSYFEPFLSFSSCPYSTRHSHPDRQYLTVPPFHSSVFKSAKHFGHSFAFDAPKIWNDLPQDVRSATSVASFRKKLKTYLFAKAYPP